MTRLRHVRRRTDREGASSAAGAGDRLAASGDPLAASGDPAAAYRLVLGREPGDEERSEAARLTETGGMQALLSQLLASDEHAALTRGARFVPPGHFYSPIPSDEDVEAAKRARRGLSELAGIDLRRAQQERLLERFATGYGELPFAATRTPGLRYYYANPNFSYSDAIFLASMIREVRPKRVVEVGSGHSSCVLLDVNERFFDGAIRLTFVEPFPDYLKSLLTPAEAKRIRLLPVRSQDVDLSEFEQLESGDVLFIDSTHVSKAGSDVNHLFFQVLPRLQAGVYVHIHDVFAGMEYPDEWLEQGRAWNEQYVLRAFLMYNAEFEVVLFGNWIVETHREWFAQHMPLCLENPGGSIWLRRRGG